MQQDTLTGLKAIGAVLAVPFIFVGMATLGLVLTAIPIAIAILMVLWVLSWLV